MMKSVAPRRETQFPQKMKNPLGMKNDMVMRMSHRSTLGPQKLRGVS